MLLRGGVGAAGRIALPVGKMVGRTGLGPPKNAPAGGVGAAGRIALPVGKMVGRTGLGPPKIPLREESALRAASPYRLEITFQHSRKPDAKSSGWF
jgi:hypothetical protein